MKRVSRPLFAVVCFVLCACCALVLAEASGHNLPMRWSNWNNWGKHIASPSASRPLTSKLHLAQSSVEPASTSASSRIVSRAVQIFEVNVTADDVDTGGCQVFSTSTDCTLREAITAANGNANPTDVDRIEFNIAGTGVRTIKPTSALPNITESVIIDGYSQPGSSVNNLALADGNDAVLLIELDGTNTAGTITLAGLFVTADNCVIKGLVINRFIGDGRFPSGEIIINDGNNNVIEGCFIGTNASGTVGLPNGSNGVLISGGDNNRIGGTAPAQRNIVSGNDRGAGVNLFNNSSNNLVQGNYIGVDKSGKVAVGNSGGIAINDGSVGNRIGGTIAGAGNVISGNINDGIKIDGTTATGNIVQGNFIGVGADGSTPLANANVGVQITNANNNTVGGTGDGQGNLIAFNGSHGVNILRSNFMPDNGGNAVRGNRIFSNGRLGINLDGDGVEANDAGDGDTGANGHQNFPVINSVTHGTNTVIRATLNSLPGVYAIDLFRNTVVDSSGNHEGQTFVSTQNVTVPAEGSVTFPMSVAGLVNDFFTMTATRNTAPFDTSEFSVGVRAPQPFEVNSTADDVDTGGCQALSTSTDCTLREAITAANANADASTIHFEIPGTAPHTIAPATPLPKIVQPVIIDGSSQTGFANTPLIVLSGQNPGVRPPTTFAAALQITADNSTIRALTINNGFAGGIAIFGDGTNTLASNNKVEGCFFGTNAAGTAASTLNGNAISISGGGIAGNGATNNIIGGTSAAQRNIINSNKPNSGYGVLIEGANTIGNRVSGNYIGTNAAGTGAIGNSFGVGIDIGTRGNLIGGPAATERNIISGNETGILIYGSSNTVQGNYIGTTQTGNAPLPNANVGVSLDAGASGNVIGGVAITPGTGRGNVISGNTGGVGVEIIGRSFGTGAFSNNNRVQGNLIGVQGDGSGALANRLGVVIKQNAFNNPIGGANAGEGNVIAHNTNEGVTIADNGTGNAIRGNNIFSNGGLGIDLGANGVTANDAGNDADIGPNNLQNFPVITSVTQNGSSTIIKARLNTAPGDYSIDLFSNTARDVSGNVEGQTYLASQQITVLASGIRDFSFTRPGTISDFFSMTATRNAAPFDTSEFSNAMRAPRVFEVNSAADDVDTGGCQVLSTSTDCTLREAITAANANTGTDIINFEIPGTGVRTISVNPALPIITGPVVIDGSSQSGFTGTPLIFLSGASITGGADGIRLNASNSTIKNLAIGNFTGSGINIGFNQTGNKVEGCFIGTNAAGTAPAANGTGIRLSSVGHTIGGVLTGQGNLISGNRGRGISDVGDGNVTTIGNTILGNTIGLNLGRNAAVSNGEGIVISSRFKTVVGSLTFGGNFISGNTRTGISVTGNFNATTPDGIVIEGNEIGGNAAKDFGNGGDGVFIGGRGCRVSFNTIVGNTGNGINLFLATQNSIQRNSIGLPGVGNDGVGVFLNNGAKNNVIGGTAADIDPVPEGNLITANGGGGVHVFSNSNGDAIGNTIRGNTIKGNVGLGIDLRKTIPNVEAANTPTANDANDPDTGNNNLQNFPVITGVTGRTITFTFNSTPNTNFVLDFYSNAGLDASLHGEGETRIGSLRFTTNGSGNSPVTSFTAAADLAGFVTATATNVTTGDTSEFSAGRRVVAGPPSLSIRNITAREGNTGTTNAVFTVTLSAASTQPVRVDFLTRNGTATAPADYTALPVTTLTIPAGSTTATITVAVKGDTIDEADETFFVKITASSNATIADGDAFALIIDDDTSGSCSAPPTGLVAWYPAEGNANDIVGNNEGTATTDVTYPTAKVGKGFDFVDGSVRVPDAASLRPTTLTAEAWVAATAPGFKYILAKSLDGGRASYAFYTSGGGLRFYVKTTVAGNGGPGAGDVWLSPGASSAIWDGNLHHIAGTFDGSTVRLFVDGVQVGSGTATQGTLIYGNTYQNGDLFIGNYNPTGSFAWPGVIDEMSLYNRALSANEIQAIFNAGGAGKCRSTTATPALSINDVSTTEGNTGTKTLSFAVTLSQASTQTITVNYATANGITNPAIAGSDYVAKTGTLTFASGVRTQPVAITINGDTAVEQNETFFVNLSAPANATITKARGIGTITNDDNVQAGSLQFSSPTYSVNESGPVATLSVTRTGGTGVAVGVSYATTNGTSVAPGDYTTKTGTLSWAIGDSATKTITVPIIDDALVEGNETFSVTLSAPTGGAVIGTPNRAVVTITNNDSPSPANGGPLILMGIDAEAGGVGGHGPIANYVAVVNSILGKVTNGGQGILVIGGGKSAGDDVTEFWNAIATGTGKPVTYVNGATNIAARSFAGFAMIAVVSSVEETPSGGLTQAENDALATRRTDVATFVNTGGGLLGFSQTGLTPLYPYIEGFGTFTFNTELNYSNITPTPAGQAIGITDALDVFAWHDEYLTFPSFLGILATNAATDKAAAIGGAAVIVGRGDALLGWGYNDYGSVGDGTRFHRPSPVTVNIIRDARLIAAGGSHNLAVAGNVLYAWGDNESGQLGDGTVTTRTEPVAITLPTGIRADGLKAIACGWYHSLAITADNRVLAWGLNKDGQCGVTPDGPRFVTRPRIVAGLANITQISGGTLHSLALDSSRRVWAWGNNFYGQLGNGTIENVKSVPTIVANLPAVQAIGAGGGHSIALLSDGTARAWGWNLYGQLGDGLSGYTNDGQERRSAIPVVVKNVSAGTQLGVGYVHNLVRKSDGTLLSWGNNFYGQLGRSTTQTNAPLAAPVMVGSAAFNNVQGMAVGTGHNLVIRTDGTIWSWGYNEFGSLGRGTMGAGQTVPQQVPGLSAARAVAAGYGHSLAIARRTTTSGLKAQTPTEYQSGVAWASSNSITLTFSASLKSIAPGGVRVLVNDKEVTVQSTSVSGTTLNVLLPNGTLEKGDEIIVAWSGLQTQSGEVLQGNSSEIIAE